MTSILAHLPDKWIAYCSNHYCRQINISIVNARMTTDPKYGKKEIIVNIKIGDTFNVRIVMINITYGKHRYNMCKYISISSQNRDCIWFAGSDTGTEPLMFGCMYSQKELENITYHNIQKNLSTSPKIGHSTLIWDITDCVKLLFSKMHEICTIQ